MLAIMTPTRHEMPNHAAYHGVLTGLVADDRLGRKEGIFFLFRYSENKKKYILAVLDSDKKVEHIEMEINTDEPLYRLQGTEKNFRSVDELVTYYQSHPLSASIRTLGKPCYRPGYKRCKIL